MLTLARSLHFQASCYLAISFIAGLAAGRASLRTNNCGLAALRGSGGTKAGQWLTPEVALPIRAPLRYGQEDLGRLLFRAQTSGVARGASTPSVLRHGRGVCVV